MYLHNFYDCINYVCIENRYVNDKIEHKLISAALLFSLHIRIHCQEKLDILNFRYILILFKNRIIYVHSSKRL